MPEGHAEEMAAVRERFAALSPGEDHEVVAAVGELCDFVEEVLGVDPCA